MITSHAAYAHFPQNRVETGILTTEHASSSYNLPVFVSTADDAFGPADLESVSFGFEPELFGADISEFERRVLDAGYTVRT